LDKHQTPLNVVSNITDDESYSHT